MPPPERDDATLVAAALAGDDRAFTDLMRRYKEPLFRFVRRYVGDADEANDIVQESFVAAWAALGGFDVARPVAVWLRRIALNKCRDWGRRRQVRQFFYAAMPLDSPVVRTLALVDGDERAADEANLGRLDAAIAALPRALKEALLLTAFEGMSHKLAAGVLGVSPKAVENRVHRARLALARALKEPRNLD